MLFVASVDGLAEMKDLGTNFFLTEQDVGHPRATAVSHKVRALLLL